MNQTDDAYPIGYEFLFEDGSSKSFTIRLDPETISIVHPRPAAPPPWTRLDNEQCPICPLDSQEHPYCPIAVNIAELVDAFKESFSYDNCVVCCNTPERSCSKETSVQEGLFSLLGIIMATSDCPVMGLFKPMARFHLPFATIQESMVRTTAFYLLRQYFAYKRGTPPDLEMKELDAHYGRVQQVNRGILDRIGSVSAKDADRNAIIILNSLAQLFNVEFEDNLTSVEYLFTQDAMDRG
ncbi:MAG: hypothetical protein SWC96_08355 [Thermodesulfobacteriota bacterium]|nr:hypothetical protein [Thermodesulfobacteriota bacterium]